MPPTVWRGVRELEIIIVFLRAIAAIPRVSGGLFGSLELIAAAQKGARLNTLALSESRLIGTKQAKPREEKDRRRACRLLLPVKQVVMCFNAANQRPTIAP